MRLTRVFVLAAALFVGSATLASAAPRPLVIGTEGAYPPWNYTRPNGQVDGFEPELMRNLCARAGFSCRIVAMDWDGMIGALQTGKIDLIADAVQITPERRAVLGFTRPYALTNGVFVTRRDNPLARMADRAVVLDFDRADARLAARMGRLRRELAGKVIGVEVSGAFDGFLAHEFGAGVTIKYYRTMGERDLDLLNGRLDATLEDAAYMNPLLATRDGAALTLTGPEVIGGAMGGGEALAMRPGDIALRARFDAAIGAALADGTVRRLAFKWFRMDATPHGVRGGGQ